MAAKTIENNANPDLLIGNDTVNDFAITYEKITQREFKFSGIPIYDEELDEFSYIDVKMRKLLQRDSQELSGLDLTNPSSIPTVISIIVTKWDGRDFITANELRLDKYEEALQCLNFCFSQVLQSKFSITPIKKK